MDTITNQSELLHTQLHTNETDTTNLTSTNHELIQKQEIKGTPFHTIGNKEKGYFIALGKFRISEPYPTTETAQLGLFHNQWEIITNLICILAEEITNITINNKNNNNQQ